MQVAATKPSLTFFQPEDIRRQGVDVWTDDDEWDVRVHVVRSKRTTLELTHTMPILLPPPTHNPNPFLADGAQPNYHIGDPILHIELRRWADIVLIAPCSANTLAKIATGVCDNLVVSNPCLHFPVLSPPPSFLPFPPTRHITSSIIRFRIICPSYP